MIIKESHRWRPVTPLGVPHALAEGQLHLSRLRLKSIANITFPDDHLDGMLLPKGSAVILNVWGMHHDPKRWQEPEHFQPERFADFPALASVYAASGEGDKRDHFGYGAGRRICPGIHLAERNLFVAVAKLLWAFEFSKLDGAVNDASAEKGSSQGFLHGPKDYGCHVRLRSEKKRETIMKEFEEAQAVFGRYE